MASLSSDDITIKFKTQADTAGVNQTSEALNKISSTGKQVEEQVGKTGGAFGGLVSQFALGNIAANAVMTGISKVSEAFQAFKDQAKESQQVQAQLNAVIKSTGDVSGVTADMANKLATSISKVTPVDQEAALSAENMLLTFTNIHKDTFPKTTQAVIDMATAMNGGAAPAADQLRDTAIQVGKALNNPIDGFTKLQRVGVTFTDQQKEQIKTMQQAGNVTGAQTVILNELSKEFGGSATASAKTFSGEMQMMKNHIVDLGGNAIVKLEGWLSNLMQSMMNLAGTKGFRDFMHDIGQDAQDVAVFFRLLWDALTGGDPTISASEGRFAGLAKTMSDLQPYIQDVEKVLGELAKVFVKFEVKLFKTEMKEAGKILSELWKILKDITPTIIKMAKEGWKILEDAVSGLMPSLKALWNSLSSQLGPVLKEIWDAIVRLYNALQPALGDVLKVIAVIIGVTLYAAIWLTINALRIIIDVFAFVVRAITDVIKWISNAITWFGQAATAVYNFGKGVVDWFINLPGNVLKAVGDLTKTLYNVGKDLVQGFINGITDMINAVGGAVKKVAKSAVDNVKSFLGIHSPSTVFHEIGQNVGQGLANGLTSMQGAVGDAMTNLSAGGIDASVNVGQSGGSFLSNPSVGSAFNNAQNTNTTNNSKTVTIGTVVLADGSAVQEWFRQLNQDAINLGRGLTANQGMVNGN